jgi:hypothetical protein
MAIRDNPHYLLPTTELAAWLRKQGEETWWNIDGDPVLNSYVTLPCNALALADEVAKIPRPLLLATKEPNARGQAITAADLDRLVQFSHPPGTVPPDRNPRFFHLSWADSDEEWLIIEDPRTAASIKKELLASKGG